MSQQQETTIRSFSPAFELAPVQTELRARLRVLGSHDESQWSRAAMFAALAAGGTSVDSSADKDTLRRLTRSLAESARRRWEAEAAEEATLVAEARSKSVLSRHFRKRGRNVSAVASEKRPGGATDRDDSESSEDDGEVPLALSPDRPASFRAGFRSRGVAHAARATNAALTPREAALAADASDDLVADTLKLLGRWRAALMPDDGAVWGALGRCVPRGAAT